jgi:hypothetical protein
MLVMTLLVRDETEIVSTNIEFHLDAGVDFVIATDNRSTDGTVDILEAYEREGVLRLIHETDDDYAQGRWVTRMARMAAVEHGADWVINNDADEFWWCQSGDLASMLASFPDEVRAVRAERVNFIARPEDDRAFWTRMSVRQQPSEPHPGIDWPTLGPKVCHRAHPAVSVGQGNHWIGIDGEGDVEPVDTDQIEILHFPIRSRAHLENKVVLGGGAYARNTELPEETGKTWRDLHALHGEGRFDAAYDGCVLSPEAIDDGLADGTLVDDRRLARHLENLAGRTLLPGAIDADRALPRVRPQSWLRRRLARRGS